MTDTEKLIETPAADDVRRAERRTFLRHASGIAMAAGASSLLAACGGSGPPVKSASVLPPPTIKNQPVRAPVRVPPPRPVALAPSTMALAAVRQRYG